MAGRFILTPKQKLFVEEYLKDLNATRAAAAAGFSAKNASKIGSQLLGKTRVAEAIQDAMDKRSKRTQITQDQVLNELRRIAFGGMEKLARWNASGVTFHDSSQLDADTLACVAEVNESTNQHGGSLKIKRFDKVKALELIGRHLGMFNDKLEIITEEDRPLKELGDAELLKMRGNGK